MQQILDLVKKLGPQRLVAMGAVTLTLIGFFAFVMLRLAQPQMTTLFADLGPSESAAVVRELETRGVKSELRADGAIVMVPREQVARLRMDLAAKGLPGGGGIGYEIFDKSDAFTATSFVQNLNQVRALEGEIARSIRTIDRVQAARVHLSIPERKLFQKDRPEARASIVLKVRGDLEPAQVRAIRHLVASAVEGLKPGRISLVDEAGRLLADGAGDENDVATASADRQASHEKRLKTQVEEIVASVVGRGRARVQVTVDLDSNRIQQTSEAYDPESRVVRSTQTRNESNASTEGNKDNQVTVANELPAAQRGGAGGQSRGEQGQKNEEVVNYEISRTTRTETIEAGRVKRLSVAVLVDGLYARNANGDLAYEARSPEEIDRIATLVRLGVGFDKARGDQVEVVNLRFAESPVVADLAAPGLFQQLLTFSRDDILRFAEVGVFVLISLLVLAFVVRPLLRQMTAPAAGEAARSDSEALAGGKDAPAVTGPDGSPALPAPAGPPTLDAIGQQIAAQPQDAAAILRNWMRSAA